MSLHPLPEPCWTIRGWHTPDAPITHYDNRADAAADADEFMDNGTADGADLYPDIEPSLCWELDCDECGTCAATEDGATAHYNPLADAATEEWLIRDDGAALCPACVLTVECRTYGHIYTPWRDCACGGTHHRHAGGCPQFRYCQRCLTYEPSWPDTTTQKEVA